MHRSKYFARKKRMQYLIPMSNGPLKDIAQLKAALMRSESVEISRCLSPVNDGVLAHGLLYLDAHTRERVYRCLGPGKTTRVREDLARLERSRYTAKALESAINQLVAALEGKRKPTERRYFRPNR